MRQGDMYGWMWEIVVGQNPNLPEEKVSRIYQQLKKLIAFLYYFNI